MILKVDDIIHEIFFNDTQQAIDKLKEYNLFEIIEKHINSINPTLDNFSTIATSLLSSINSILKGISNEEDKSYLEYLISDIANHIIKKFFSEGYINSREIIELDIQFKTVCKVHGYNYNDFQRLLPLQKIGEYLIINQSNEGTTKIAYYEWTNKDYILDELAKNLKSEKIIHSVKDFKKLFSSQPVKVVFDKEQIDFIIILFDELYSLNYIKPKVKKGHFLALKENAIDQDQKTLFKNDMKHLNYSIKKNTAKCNKIRLKVEKWLALK